MVIQLLVAVNIQKAAAVANTSTFQQLELVVCCSCYAAQLASHTWLNSVQLYTRAQLVNGKVALHSTMACCSLVVAVRVKLSRVTSQLHGHLHK
jgi:hypothetical protein